MQRCRFLLSTSILMGAMAILSACEEPQALPVLSHKMGERIPLGPMSYVVVSSEWATQLGEGFNVRSPSNRFLIINIAVTNGGGESTSIPLLTLESSDGKVYEELQDGAGLTNWLGVIRRVAPAETMQGRMLFDVPLTSYRLRIPDVADETLERNAWIDIPLDLQMDDVVAPLPTMEMN